MSQHVLTSHTTPSSKIGPAFSQHALAAAMFRQSWSHHVGHVQRWLAMHTMKELFKRSSVSLMVHRKFQCYAFFQKRGQLGGAGTDELSTVGTVSQDTLLSIIF
jgi:hypothetical protein